MTPRQLATEIVEYLESPAAPQSRFVALGDIERMIKEHVTPEVDFHEPPELTTTDKPPLKFAAP